MSCGTRVDSLNIYKKAVDRTPFYHMATFVIFCFSSHSFSTVCLSSTDVSKTFIINSMFILLGLLFRGYFDDVVLTQLFSTTQMTAEDVCTHVSRHTFCFCFFLSSWNIFIISSVSMPDLCHKTPTIFVIRINTKCQNIVVSKVETELSTKR